MFQTYSGGNCTAWMFSRSTFMRSMYFTIVPACYPTFECVSPGTASRLCVCLLLCLGRLQPETLAGETKGGELLLCKRRNPGIHHWSLQLQDLGIALPKGKRNLRIPKSDYRIYLYGRNCCVSSAGASWKRHAPLVTSRSYHRLTWFLQE